MPDEAASGPVAAPSSESLSKAQERHELAAHDLAFDATFAERLHDLMVWRRDVRHFQSTELPDDAVERLVAAANLAPSVGYSQPWRFVSIQSASARSAIQANFAAANAEALQAYEGDKAKLYASLKLAGLEQAPTQLAVFCDEATETGSGLGRRTMPEMLAYSVVAAIQNLCLAARARGIGVGWVSILDPKGVTAVAQAPDTWRLIAYLCIGYPTNTAETPELLRRGWDQPNAQATSLRRV